MTAAATAPTANPTESLALDLAAGEDARDLSGSQAAQVRALVTDDLFSFAWLVMGLQGLLYYPIHGPVCRFIERWGTPDNQRLMIQLPRDIGKTSLATKSNSLWRICRNPNDTIGIFNETDENAGMFVRGIRETAQSSVVFKALFGHLLPPGVAAGGTAPRTFKWNDTELLFQRDVMGLNEMSITGMGIGSTATGKHFTHIIKDDIISKKAQDSPLVMASAQDWFDKSFFLERPALMGNDLIVCTPYTHNDVYVHALKTHNYTVYRRSGLEGGESIWPKKMPTDVLLKYQSVKPEEFASQVMCRPMAGSDTSFKAEWLRDVRYDTTTDEPTLVHDHYDPTRSELPPDDPPPRTVPLHMIAKMILVDPAPTELGERRRDPGSRNGITVPGCDPWGRKYLLEAWAGRPDPIDVIDKVLALATKWGAYRIGMEEHSFGRIYRHWLLEKAKARKIPIQVIPMAVKGREKGARIQAMIAPTREGWWHVLRDNCREWEQEYREYPYSATSDLMDSWAFSADVLHRPVSIGERLHSQWRQREMDRGRDPVTHY